MQSREISESRRSEIEKHWKEGYVQVKKATAAGAFLISDETERALAAFWKERDKGVHPNDWFGMIDSHYAAARTCLRSIVAAAKNDLAVHEDKF